jgi:5-methylcytosine-specific restriction protein A
MPWETTGSSKRRLELPADWSQRREETKRLAGGRCQWRMPNGGRCPEPGTDCDHVGDSWDHSVTNRRWLCRRHHNMHTGQQSAEARRALAAKAKHPVERHPGLRD